MQNLNNQKHYIIKFRNEQINTKEIIDTILDNLEVQGKEAFNLGNVLKYVIRYKHKNGHEDLRKAIVYLEYILDIKSRQELENDLKSEINELLLKNAEFEIENDRLRNELYNLKIDFERETNHIEDLNKVIFNKDNIIYKLTRGNHENRNDTR